jgi:hypothetical protein
LILWEGLHAHVGAICGWCVDGCVVQESGAGPTWEGLWGCGVGAGGWRLAVSQSRGGRLGNVLGTGDNNMELRLPLSDIGGIGECKSCAEECALYASHGGRIWAGAVIWGDRWITLKVYSSSELILQNALTKVNSYRC